MKCSIWVLVISLVLIPTILIGSISSSYMCRTMENMQDEELHNVTDIVSHNMKSSFQKILTRTQKDSSREEFREVLLRGTMAGDRDQFWLQQAKQLLYDDNANIEGGSLIDLNGKVLISTDREMEGLMLDKAELYQNIIKGSPFYESPLIDKNNNYKLEVAVPITDKEGCIIGILRHIVNLKDIQQYIETIKLSNTGCVYLIRQDGSVILNRNVENEALVFTGSEENKDLNELLQNPDINNLTVKSGSFEAYYKGRAMMGVYKTLPGLKWIIASMASRDEIYKEVEKEKSVIFAASAFVATIVIVAGYLFAISLTNPLFRLNTIMKRIADGDLTLRCAYEGRKREYQELCCSVNRLADNLQKCETELRMSTRVDSLTRLPNRYTINEVLDTLLYMNPKQAIIMVSLDDFHQVNEKHGYETGDRLLCEIGTLLRALPTHICYPFRIMGDEFLVFISGWDDNSYPEKIAERIISEINNIDFIDDKRINISASAGIEYLTEEKMEKEKLIKHANIALNKAKKLGKNTYTVYSRMNHKKY